MLGVVAVAVACTYGAAVAERAVVVAATAVVTIVVDATIAVVAAAVVAQPIAVAEPPQLVSCSKPRPQRRLNYSTNDYYS